MTPETDRQRQALLAELEQVTEDNDRLRAQNAELLAALRDMVGSHGLVQRVICVSGELDPDVAMRNAKTLLVRITGTSP